MKTQLKEIHKKAIENDKKEISKELDPLIKEARKYKTLDEFLRNKLSKGLRLGTPLYTFRVGNNEFSIETNNPENAQKEAIAEAYNMSTRGIIGKEFFDKKNVKIISKLKNIGEIIDIKISSVKETILKYTGLKHSFDKTL